MEQHAFILRGIADRLKLKSVRDLAMLPGVRDIYRVTLHYPDMRASDAVATLQLDNTSNVLLEVIYYGRFGNKPLQYQWDIKRYEAFVNAIKPAAFDKLSDQSLSPMYGEDLCLIERGASGFVKSVIFVPQKAENEYASLRNCVEQYIPEAIREIT